MNQETKKRRRRKEHRQVSIAIQCEKVDRVFLDLLLGSGDHNTCEQTGVRHVQREQSILTDDDTDDNQNDNDQNNPHLERMIESIERERERQNKGVYFDVFAPVDAFQFLCANSELSRLFVQNFYNQKTNRMRSDTFDRWLNLICFPDRLVCHLVPVLVEYYFSSHPWPKYTTEIDTSDSMKGSPHPLVLVAFETAMVLCIAHYLIDNSDWWHRKPFTDERKHEAVHSG